MAQNSELLTMVFGVAAALVLIIRRKRLVLPGASVPFHLGWALVLAAYVFTVVETWVLPSFFNGLEHLCFASAGVAFAVTAWRWRRHGAGRPGETPP